MNDKYFNYLVNLVDKQNRYSLLLKELYNIEYYATVPNDDNRGSDGLYLREQYLESMGHMPLSFCHTDECTILEMLIGLSYRLEFETAQSIYEKRPEQWFWILIDNLKLTHFADKYIKNKNDHIQAINIIRDIINKLLDRTYFATGEGGLFPLINPKKDQRRVEIWYQMTDYIEENYPIV